jgi:ABC-type multidrug transport system ATPase subunit
LKNAKKVKSKVALMLESDMLYYRLTAYDNLKFFCKLYKVSNYQQKINDMVKLLGIEDWLGQYVEHLSSGMKMKLALARTLLLERDILFLDEPTLGLDVKTVNLFIDIIKNTESTVIFTSHDLSVVEKLCDRIAFINEGKILKIGTQEEVKDLLGPGITLEITLEKGSQELISELKGQDFTSEKIEGKSSILVHLKDRKYYRNLLKILKDYEILKIKEVETSLENLFLKLVN